MNTRALGRYVDDLLGGRRPQPFRPDDFETAQIRAAIDLRAARYGRDSPRQEFLTDLQRRLAAQMDGSATVGSSPRRLHASRRQVIVGTSAAAAGVAAGPTADRLPSSGGRTAGSTNSAAGDMVPGQGSWQAVASSADVRDRDASVRARFAHRVRSTGRRPLGGGVGHMHASGLPAVVRPGRRSAALPLPLDVLLPHRAGGVPSAAHHADTVAHTRGSQRDGAIEVFVPIEPTQPS